MWRKWNFSLSWNLLPVPLHPDTSVNEDTYSVHSQSKLKVNNYIIILSPTIIHMGLTSPHMSRAFEYYTWKPGGRHALFQCFIQILKSQLELITASSFFLNNQTFQIASPGPSYLCRRRGEGDEQRCPPPSTQIFFLLSCFNKKTRITQSFIGEVTISPRS